MAYHNQINRLRMLPNSFKHILWVKNQLIEKSYQDILSEDFKYHKISADIHDVVKSYFWASRLIGRDNCLPRSIALYQNLTKRGFNVEHKFGVNKTNKRFKAHAWVEYQGKPLNEHPLLHQRFRVLEKHK